MNKEDDYENDLQLAAELGKTLLERNKELEMKLKLSTKIQNELTEENKLLTNQLETSRGINEYRMSVYEEIDRSFAESEKKNKTLNNQLKEERDRSKRLTEELQSVELKLEQMQIEIDEFSKFKSGNSQNCGALETGLERRAQSVPSLVEIENQTLSNVFPFDTPQDFTGTTVLSQHNPRYISSSKAAELNGVIRNMRLQLQAERRKRQEIETDLTCVEKENTRLISQLECMTSEQERIDSLECELQSAERVKAGKLCRMCGQRIESSIDSIEHDLEFSNHRINGELIPLTGESNEFESQGFINNLGLFVKPTTDTNKFSISLISAGNENSVNVKNPQIEQVVSKNSILMNEATNLTLHNRTCGHYKDSLLYELNNRVINGHSNLDSRDSKCHSQNSNFVLSEFNSRPDCLNLMSMSSHKSNVAPSVRMIDLKSPLDPTVGHFEKGPPEYKLLFAEIFQTLRRSLNSDNDDPGD